MSISLVTSLPPLPSRADNAHKGSFGKVLIIGGSRGMSGAVCLAGMGALRGGAGLVTLAVPAGILPIVASVEPSYLTHPLPDDDRGRIGANAAARLPEFAEKHTAVAIGPGCGTSSALRDLVYRIYATVPRPLVVDADGLNALAQNSLGLPEAPISAARILTPHPGEFARLLKTDIEAVQRDRESLAAGYALQHGVILLLKGQGTVITDGRRLALNPTGNSGMATGGTGDVLTGLITALLAQGMPAFEAAQLGAYLHGAAGDLAAAALSSPALIASDLPRYLPEAWKQAGA